MRFPRSSGLLLPITSLPSDFGIGDLGPGAFEFVDFLARSRQSMWQVLPVHPTLQSHGNSPYSSTSAFAGNPLMISPRHLVRDEWLTEEELSPKPEFDDSKVLYEAVIEYKEDLLDKAFQRFAARGGPEDYRRFCEENKNWLDDYALFAAARAKHSRAGWHQWDTGLRNREPEALESFRKAHADVIERRKFIQYLFYRQWFELKAYAGGKGIRIVGDIPIYVNHDGADVWSHQELFKLDDEGLPTKVAGVPPDYFSETGQLWGNPVYDWDKLKARGYGWWLDRLAHMFKLYDIVRIDHFRGLIAYWEVAAGEKTAINGDWVPVPFDDFYRTLSERFDELPIIAEDLGTITDDVREAIARYDLPGMKLLIFAFGEDDPNHIYLPHTYPRNCVVYTGTHDNNTARGWFEREASAEDKERLFAYLGRKIQTKNVHWELVRLAQQSVADICLLPIQDILGLKASSRINLPATAKGNWAWRLYSDMLTNELAEQFGEMTRRYGRADE